MFNVYNILYALFLSFRARFFTVTEHEVELNNFFDRLVYPFFKNASVIFTYFSVVLYPVIWVLQQSG